MLTMDDLYDEDGIVPAQPTEAEPAQEEDFLSDYLKTKGIEDSSKINFEDEQGNIITRDWNSLSKEEKFNILNTPLEEQHQEDNNNLSNEEIQFINTLRQAGMTPQQYIGQLQQQEPVEPQYKIDDLSDDELYILDLESRVGELTDDQAVQALSVAKQNEELYKKQVEGIRKEYKEREDFESQQNQAQLEQEQQEAFMKYQNAVVNAIDNFNSVGNLDLNLEDADKEDLAEFMLSQDESGVNYLYQALQEPETLVKAAWFILNGDEALNNISDYFAKQIKLVSESQYQKGLADGRANITKPTVVIDTSKRNQTPHQYKSIKNIDDLDDED